MCLLVNCLEGASDKIELCAFVVTTDKPLLRLELTVSQTVTTGGHSNIESGLLVRGIFDDSEAFEEDLQECHSM
jgi:hypothetical protein